MDGTPFIYFNDGGVLFYTKRTHLYEAIIALAVLGASKRRSQLTRWREGADPDPIPSPTFQFSPVAINQDYIQQTTILLATALATAAVTARYGWA